MADAATAQEMSEDLELIEEARQEYLVRLVDVQKLQGSEFEEAANALEAWADDVNEDLNDAAQEILGEGLAVNTESLEVLRLERGAQPAEPA